jgi:hypothetical protein
MDTNTPQIFPHSASSQRQLPNATATLILGIISILTCCIWGGGLVLGIIALVLAGKDKKLYLLNPEAYTKGSYENLKAGKVCAIIGVIISALYLLLIVIAIGLFGIAVLTNPQALQQALQNMSH